MGSWPSRGAPMPTQSKKSRTFLLNVQRWDIYAFVVADR
jgi:hypothetical protein